MTQDNWFQTISLLIQFLVIPTIFYIFGRRGRNADIKKVESSTESEATKAHGQVIDDAINVGHTWKEIADYKEGEITGLENKMKIVVEQQQKTDIVISELKEINERLIYKIQILEDRLREKEKTDQKILRLKEYTKGLSDAYNYLSRITRSEEVLIARAMIPEYKE